MWISRLSDVTDGAPQDDLVFSYLLFVELWKGCRGRHLQQNSGCIQSNISSYLDIVNFPPVYINPAKEVNDLSKAKQALLHESNNLILKTILQKRHTAILLVRTGTGVTSAYSFTSPLQTYGLGVPPIWLHKLRTQFERDTRAIILVPTANTWSRWEHSTLNFPICIFGLMRVPFTFCAIS